MKVDMSTSKRIPDGPCVKCGETEVVKLSWWSAEWQPFQTPFHVMACRALGEHFHHHCQRCGYDWVTTDMLDAPTTEAAHVAGLEGVPCPNSHCRLSYAHTGPCEPRP